MAPQNEKQRRADERTKIEWCDYTFNPWVGCTKVSEGCVHCYAETLMATRWGKVTWGAGQPRMRTSPANWALPLKWNKLAGQGLFMECERCGGREFREWNGIGATCCTTPGCNALPETEGKAVRPRVFCASLADWLDPEVPIEWLADLLYLINATPYMDWLLLTKRPELWLNRMQSVYDFWRNGHDKYIRAANMANFWMDGYTPINVWVGATVENEDGLARIKHLLGIPSRVHFLSCEPLLGPVQATHDTLSKIDWVICGGESGPNARPMHPDWARSLRDQCQAAGVAFFFKQWGEWIPGELAPGKTYYIRCDNGLILGGGANLKKHDFGTDFKVSALRVGKAKAGRLLDGREWNEFPCVTPVGVTKNE